MGPVRPWAVAAVIGLCVLASAGEAPAQFTSVNRWLGFWGGDGYHARPAECNVAPTECPHCPATGDGPQGLYGGPYGAGVHPVPGGYILPGTMPAAPLPAAPLPAAPSVREDAGTPALDGDRELSLPAAPPASPSDERPAVPPSAPLPGEPTPALPPIGPRTSDPVLNGPAAATPPAGGVPPAPASSWRPRPTRTASLPRRIGPATIGYSFAGNEIGRDRLPVGETLARY